ncbi:hypothetical protein [Pseudomonas vanderleydeniana]|uniref:Uncharacterized protein n=1 Tax=Pseudomonas vanderleydeniana TaxID=2745495 RepID=A0A9E6TUM2_9PSED|nr:hypothetical protein [Pseudomonas vanderleydeniana]QXI30716.1 hypothetical protein HU752_012545 [Pseudomonas vanderleydeniana]
MTNHVIESHTLTVQPNDTIEITRWPGAQSAGNTALLIGNLVPAEDRSIRCYAATVAHTSEGSVKVVKVTVPAIPHGHYGLHLSTGGAFIRVVGVQLS